MNVYREQATFYRAALLLGLLRGERVIAWADAAIADDPGAPAAFADIAITPPAEFTLLRQNLLLLASEKESPAVVAGLIDLIHRDLATRAEARRISGKLVAISLGAAVRTELLASEHRTEARRASDGRENRFTKLTSRRRG